jgi:hypothetical protein
MKQVEKTPEIVAKLQKAVGDGVDTSNLAVFEAIALNSLPLRKQHPLYNGAVVPSPFLSEMATALNAESLPVYLMHDSGAPTPFGRAFFSDVQNGELRTLFFVDKAAHPDVVGKLDNGTVDQVSVSIVPKAAVCADCGFDFLGPESDLFENVLSGTDPKGHVMGEDGKHVVMQGLDTFNELSLVGRGGARNARVVNRNDQKLTGSNTIQRLAASGVDLSIATLVASAESSEMDLTKLVAELTDSKAAKIAVDGKVTELTAQLTAANTKATDLEAKLADAEKKEGFVKQADLDAAMVALRDVAKKVLVASGKVDAETKDFDVATCVATIDETSKAMAAKLVAGGKSKDATDNAEKSGVVTSGAFRTRS